MRHSRRILARTFALCSMMTLWAHTALALDCTPLGTLPLDGTTVADLIGSGAVPGEPACGQDYTGQDFHVWEFTLTEPSQVVLFLATGGQSFGSPPPDAELFVLSSCDPTACIATFANESGATSDPICLPAGTYSLVVASPDAGGNNSYSTAVAVVASCEPVSNESSSWSALKGSF